VPHLGVCRPLTHPLPPQRAEGEGENQGARSLSERRWKGPAPRAVRTPPPSRTRLRFRALAEQGRLRQVGKTAGADPPERLAVMFGLGDVRRAAVEQVGVFFRQPLPFPQRRVARLTAANCTKLRWPCAAEAAGRRGGRGSGGASGVPVGAVARAAVAAGGTNAWPESRDARRGFGRQRRASGGGAAAASASGTGPADRAPGSAAPDAAARAQRAPGSGCWGGGRKGGSGCASSGCAATAGSAPRARPVAAAGRLFCARRPARRRRGSSCAFSACGAGGFPAGPRLLRRLADRIESFAPCTCMPPGWRPGLDRAAVRLVTGSRRGGGR